MAAHMVGKDGAPPLLRRSRAFACLPGKESRAGAPSRVPSEAHAKLGVRNLCGKGIAGVRIVARTETLAKRSWGFRIYVGRESRARASSHGRRYMRSETGISDLG